MESKNNIVCDNINDTNSENINESNISTQTNCEMCTKKLTKYDKVILNCNHGYHLLCIMNYYSDKRKNNSNTQCVYKDCNKHFKYIPIPIEKQYKNIYMLIDRPHLLYCAGVCSNKRKCGNLSFPGYGGFCKIHGNIKLTDRTMALLTEFYINIPLYIKNDIRCHLYMLCKLKLEQNGDMYHTIDDIEKELSIIYMIKFKSFDEIYKYFGFDYHPNVIF